jgi:hypothetical protein
MIYYASVQEMMALCLYMMDSGVGMGFYTGSGHSDRHLVGGSSSHGGPGGGDIVPSTVAKHIIPWNTCCTLIPGPQLKSDIKRRWPKAQVGAILRDPRRPLCQREWAHVSTIGHCQFVGQRLGPVRTEMQQEQTRKLKL